VVGGLWWCEGSIYIVGTGIPCKYSGFRHGLNRIRPKIIIETFLVPSVVSEESVGDGFTELEILRSRGYAFVKNFL